MARRIDDLRFEFSQVYYGVLNKHDPVIRPWPDVVIAGKEFWYKYEGRFEEMLDTIEGVCGKKLVTPIYVYVTDWNGPSFSKPLTLKMYKSMKMTLVVLIHELIHQFDSDSYDDDPEAAERKIDEQVKGVLDEMGIDAKAELKTLSGFHDKRFKKG